MTQKAPQNLWLVDVRVRERNLKSGALTEKDVEKYLTALPDLEKETDAFGVGQPALDAVDDVEDDVDDEDDAPAAPAAADEPAG